MSEQREIKDVHSVVEKALRAIDQDPNDHIQWHKPSMSQGKGTSGHADFRILYHGVWIDIECKYDMWIKYPVKLSTAKGRLPTVLQCKQLERTELAGGLALVVDRHTMHLVEDVLATVHRFGRQAMTPTDYMLYDRKYDVLHWKQFARDTPEVEL